MTQQADVKSLVKKAGLDKTDSLTAKTPYRSGYPVDAIPHKDMSITESDTNSTKLSKNSSVASHGSPPSHAQILRPSPTYSPSTTTIACQGT